VSMTMIAVNVVKGSYHYVISPIALRTFSLVVYKSNTRVGAGAIQLVKYPILKKRRRDRVIKLVSYLSLTSQ
jgi:hypothetical protein